MEESFEEVERQKMIFSIRLRGSSWMKKTGLKESF
jgi:hypothetical protein